MKSQAPFSFLALISSALTHTIFTNLHINGIDQGETKGVRYRREHSNYPIEDVTSNDLACNVDGSNGVQDVLTVPANATLYFEFQASLTHPSKQRLELGHKGPCAVYLKAVSSAKDDVGYGDGWFKIFDEGYNEDSSEWCTTKRTPTGMLEVKLPEGLKGGEYLARPELLALHNAPEGRPQFFTGCFQIKVDGDRGNGLVPEETVRIPGYVKGDDKSVTFNIYSEGSEAGYTTPGPELAKLIVK